MGVVALCIACTGHAAAGAWHNHPPCTASSGFLHFFLLMQRVRVWAVCTRPSNEKKGGRRGGRRTSRGARREGNNHTATDSHKQRHTETDTNARTSCSAADVLLKPSSWVSVPVSAVLVVCVAPACCIWWP